AHDLVDQASVEDPRNKPRADALDAVWSRRPPREHGAVLGLDRDHPETGLARLEHRADAGQGAAGPDRTDHDIDGAAGIAPDFLRCRRAVDRRVGRVVELPG